MIPQQLVLATGNQGKVRELSALITEWPGAKIVVRSLAEFPGVVLPEETGDTYEANAALKAEAVARATGLPALADDSGLEVDALGGRPGVHSARYGSDDADRVARLLAALQDLPEAKRTARFRCVVVLAWPDGRRDVGEGRVLGWIATARRGTGGFGYDPVFFCPEIGCAFGEAEPSLKASVSHRARAVRALGEALRVGSAT